MKTLSPNDLGGKYLVEHCQKLRVSEFLSKFKQELKEAVSNSEIEVLGIMVEIVSTKPNYGGKREWFKCPICGGRKGVLYKHPVNEKIGCRQCLNLEYRKRRYKGMLENSFGK